MVATASLWRRRLALATASLPDSAPRHRVRGHGRRRRRRRRRRSVARLETLRRCDHADEQSLCSRRPVVQPQPADAAEEQSKHGPARRQPCPRVRPREVWRGRKSADSQPPAINAHPAVPIPFLGWWVTGGLLPALGAPSLPTYLASTRSTDVYDTVRTLCARDGRAPR